MSKPEPRIDKDGVPWGNPACPFTTVSPETLKPWTPEENNDAKA